MGKNPKSVTGKAKLKADSKGVAINPKGKTMKSGMGVGKLLKAFGDKIFDNGRDPR